MMDKEFYKSKFYLFFVSVCLKNTYRYIKIFGYRAIFSQKYF